ncbi:lasso peptide biosynthesis B2 protein [Allosaccharopolyspora coralli]|uniref:Lasso peptide biosynthesis B2 protein n=1 Tax=Allosaccharopolyspora coralli TaxID=2665642 RepID=A0A5Q3Q4R2_9PSEU|nr:lasso peptide biosynthesis B2 protein [Allosaccharopolyspora coralli]QGK68486.1 lasso peptide biosynthesis B2 protein [Allosaccharopolyspora coralli]
MSTPIPLPPAARLSLVDRAVGLTAVGAARLIALTPPVVLMRLLRLLRTGARPATYREAARAREIVTSVSIMCAGEGCVQRSIATVVISRLRGSWPIWRSGVRHDPFRAHAWVEAEGHPVEEPETTTGYTPILSV